MGQSMSTVLDSSIQHLAFLPPQRSYNSQQNVTTLRTISGQDIAVRVTSHLQRPYIHGLPYTDSRQFILFSHGNADDAGTCQDYIDWLASTFNSNVLTYDYVNYGCSSPGTTTEKNMHEAITTVYAYMTDQLHVPATKIILLGKSIGTAPTCFLAAQEFTSDILGVVLISPLASGIRAIMPSMLASRRIFSSLDSVFCPSLAFIQDVYKPVLIIHGYEDKVINIMNARILAQNLNIESKYKPLFVHAGHNDIEETHPITVRDTISTFIQHCEVTLARKEERNDALVSYDFE